MNLISRTITGAVMIIVGLILVILPFFIAEKSAFFMWIYGLPILIIGSFIFFNKGEDKIEEIKYSSKLNKKVKRRKK